MAVLNRLVNAARKVYLGKLIGFADNSYPQKDLPDEREPERRAGSPTSDSL
jgi:hypothetical protein